MGGTTDGVGVGWGIGAGSVGCFGNLVWCIIMGLAGELRLEAAAAATATATEPQRVRYEVC